MSSKHSYYRDAERIPAHIRKRMRPSLIVVDSNLNIVHFEGRAITLLSDTFGSAPAERLPQALETPVRSAIRTIGSDGSPGLASAESLIVHASRLLGGDGPLYALLIERESFRAPVDSAATRFSLTAREREVLLHVMRGYQASDIAERLNISQATLSGYFKALLRKTQTRTRSEMVAKILDWDESSENAAPAP